MAIRLADLCYWQASIDFYCFLWCIDENPDGMGGSGHTFVETARH